MATRIVNIKSGAKYDIYGGRPGPFGNPYVVGEFAHVNGKRVIVRNRDEAIDLYAAFFETRVSVDREFRWAVLDCVDKVLGCYCRPKRCHLDVIVAWLRKHAKEYCGFCCELKSICAYPPY